VRTRWAQNRIPLIAIALLQHGTLTGDEIGVMIDADLNAASRRRGQSNSKMRASWSATTMAGGPSGVSLAIDAAKAGTFGYY
jgi:hypothetical protein